MASLDELSASIAKASAAGDEEAVKVLASAYHAEADKNDASEFSLGGSKASKAAGEGLTQAGRGAVQVGGKMLMGALSQPVSGVEGLWDAGKALYQGKPLDEAVSTGAKAVEHRQQAMAGLVPENQAAKNIGAAIAAPIEMVNSGLKTAGGAVGSLIGPKSEAAGETIGENAVNAVGSLYGARALGKGLTAARAMEPVLTQRQNAMYRAQGHKYTPNPMDTAGGGVNNVLGTVANAPALDALFAEKNADVTTSIAKSDVGISEEGFLNDLSLSKLETKAEKAYAKVATEGDRLGVSFHPDPELAQALGNADGALHSQRATYPEYYKNNALEKIKSIILNPSEPPTASVVMKLARDLRTDASKQLRNPSLNTSEIKGAVAMKNVATVLEDFVDRKLNTAIYTGGEAAVPARSVLPPLAAGVQPSTAVALRPVGAAGATPAESILQMPSKDGGLLSRTGGTSDAIDKYRGARTLLAKIHNIRETTNLETGHLDPAKLARMADAGAPLTGGLADIVQAHRAMGNVVHGIEGAAVNTGIRASDSTVGRATTMAHAAAEYIVIPLAIRKVMASKLYNEYMSTRTVDSLEQLRKLDPKLAAKAVAAMNTRLPEKMQ